MPSNRASNENAPPTYPRPPTPSSPSTVREPGRLMSDAESQEAIERLYGQPPVLMQVQINALARIERKLDTLIAALAEEDEEPEDLTLDGHPAGRERDQSQGL
jgi:hypothetical protein